MSQVAGLHNNSYTPITNTAYVRARLCKLQKGCTRLAAASDKIYQLLANGRWFSPGTPASSTTKTGRHDIAEIWLKVALNTEINHSINPIQSYLQIYIMHGLYEKFEDTKVVIRRSKSTRQCSDQNRRQENTVTKIDDKTIQ